MDHTRKTINALLLKTFNDSLIIEQTALKQGVFSDLTIAEMHTIEAIGLFDQKTMGQVARELSVTVGTLTVAVNSLVKKSYVERFRVDEDRRLVKVKLSKRGRVAFRMHRKFHEDLIRHTMDGLSEEEERILESALLKLNGFIKEFQANIVNKPDKSGGSE